MKNNGERAAGEGNNGEKEYERIYGLGGAELLKRAADAVVTFHMLEPSTGEG
jgi:hypothetical protein